MISIMFKLIMSYLSLNLNDHLTVFQRMNFGLIWDALSSQHTPILCSLIDTKWGQSLTLFFWISGLFLVRCLSGWSLIRWTFHQHAWSSRHWPARLLMLVDKRHLHLNWWNFNEIPSGDNGQGLTRLIIQQHNTGMIA